MEKKAVISGIKGQDASYLAELLLSKGYAVIGIERRCSAPDYSNIKHLVEHPNLTIECGDITDFGSIARIVKQYEPDEFYNLCAQSFVGSSWDEPISTCQIDFVGVCNCLEAVRLFAPKCKFFQASTSEVFGDVVTDVQNEESPARPRSIYGAAKLGAESLVKVYRESYNMTACFARSFNHESERRGKQFVTRKITDYIGRTFNIVEKYAIDNKLTHSTNQVYKICLENGLIKPLHLGNLGAKRDWSHAEDVVKAMYLILQSEKPDNYIIASGKTRTIKEFLNKAFSVINIENWKPYIFVDPKFYRPAEVNLLCGDYSKIKEELGWEPTIKFDELVDRMVKHDIKLNSRN